MFGQYGWQYLVKYTHFARLALQQPYSQLGVANGYAK